jgi:hypothetical protein
MFDDLYDAISFGASWTWPEATGEVTAADIERIRDGGGSVRQRLAVAFKFSVNGDGPYTGESFWNPAFFVNRRVLAARRRIRVGQPVVVRYRKDDPSVNRIRDWTNLLGSESANDTERLRTFLERGEEHATGRGNRRRSKRWLRLSRRDGWTFAFFYLLIFVVLRFDIRRSGSSFQHPTPTAISAWIALLVAGILTAYLKIRRNWR